MREAGRFDDPHGLMEFLAVDFEGNIYVNDLSRQRLTKYTQFRP